MTTDQPILWLVARGLVEDVDHFYQKIARLLGLRYIDELPVNINDSGSLAHKIGAEVQSKYLFFAYRKDGFVTIATPDPTLGNDMLENTLPFLLEKPREVRFAICPVSVVREAILQSSYGASTRVAESTLKEGKPSLSSYAIFNHTFVRVLLLLFLLSVVICFFFPYASFFAIYVFINMFYFVLNPVRFFITLAGAKSRLPVVTNEQVTALRDENLPIYTLLLPMKHEAAVAGELINHLKKMQYPPDRLDIKIVAEVDDTETIDAVRKELSLQNNHTADSAIFDFIKVPVGSISTKPRSLNFALQFARGSVCVIYDAEDKPDVYQLKKAYATFLDQKLDTLCVQGKLNYYNSRQNILTRLFSMEYSFWFDALLPGLQKWHIPLPLGGTSNHFITDSLRRIGMWDPYNVTEDADIGWRLSRLGYKTAMVDSYTLEEASSTLWQWIKQRTRWQKGFLMTLLVHTRTPGKMWQELGPWGFMSSLVLFTTNFFLPVVNPLLWFLFFLWYIPLLFGLPGIGFLTIPFWLEIAGLVNLLFGNGVYLFIHALGVIKIKRYDLLPLLPLLPLYWFLISFASFRALWQIVKDPYQWEKTPHGLGK